MKTIFFRYGQWFILAIVLILMIGISNQANAFSPDSDEFSAEGRLVGWAGQDLSALTPEGGAPFYPGDEKWQFGLDNPNSSLRGSDGSYVSSINVAGNELYIAGYFHFAGTQPARNTARWDGNSWNTFGDELNGWINQKVAIGEDLYVSGGFTQAGGQTAKWIARWDGSAWHSLGEGVNGAIYNMMAFGNDLIVTGNFTQAGGQAANFIARWDGNAWHSLGGGLTQPGAYMTAAANTLTVVTYSEATGERINSVSRWDGSTWFPIEGTVTGLISEVAAIGNNLYVYGFLNSIGGYNLPGNRVVWWNGSTWQDMNPGINNHIYLMAVVGNELYLSGMLNDSSSYYFARWDGSALQMLDAYPYGYVYKIVEIGTDLYVSNMRTMPDGQLMPHIARWNGSSWSTLWEGSTTTYINDLAVVGSDLIVAGNFHQLGDQVVNGLARWDGSAWHSLGGGVTKQGEINAFTVKENILYAGGSFELAGSLAVGNVARWDGSTWQPLGVGVNGSVNSLVVWAGYVCAGGNFSQAGGQAANSVACWDGSTWQALGAGLYAGMTPVSVEALAVLNGELIVGGSFTQAGNQNTNSIARWDGSTWHDLSGGLTNGMLPGSVKALAVLDGKLFVGGSFAQAGGQPANDIAQWDGSTWQALGSELAGINTLAVMDGALYAGGTFTQPSKGVARWDGSTWQAVGSGLAVSYHQGVLDLFAVPGGLYAVGEFRETMVDGYPADGIAWWDGDNWSRLGSSFIRSLGTPSAVTVIGDSVYVGGSFTLAGNKVSPSFAIWHNRPELTVSYPTGAPGSVFTINGNYFPPDTAFTVQISRLEGQASLANSASQQAAKYSQVTDVYGGLVLNLKTFATDQPGKYQVQVSSANDNLTIDVQIDNTAPLREPVSSASLISLDGLLIRQVFLPAVVH